MNKPKKMQDYDFSPLPYQHSDDIHITVGNTTKQYKFDKAQEVIRELIIRGISFSVNYTGL